MPLFVAFHKWKKENFKTVAGKAIEASAQFPEGANLCYSYVRADLICGKQKSAEQVRDFLRKMVPEMETEVVPALQWWPPSPDVYAIMHTLIS